MGRALVLGAAVAALAFAPAAAAPAPARDWSRTVAATPEGGVRIGNPAAKVKLVEYGSLTCGHCATFARAGVPPLLARYVKPGRVSYEFRNYVLNAPDMAASLLARCAGPQRFFPLADAFFLAQPQWFGRLARLSPAEQKSLDPLDPNARLGKLAEIGGLFAIAARAGLPAARSRQCLADRSAVDRLLTMEQAAAAQFGVSGTPSFIINGAFVGTHAWPALEQLIRNAGG